MKHNLLLLTDSYKLSHYVQYPPKTNKIYSYLESRGGKFDETVMFGLQYFIKEYLEGIAFTEEDIKEAEEVSKLHFGNEKLFNIEGWKSLYNKYGGKLPIKINAVPEGTIVNTHNVLMTIENTDPEFYWLTNYLETLLVQTWYPITVATQSREIKKIIKKYLDETATSSDGLMFKLHDFGFRGVSSVESAGIGGAAHLVNFMGTDTLAGITMLRKYYNSQMAGFSIPASEHSTITSWGKENEAKAFDNMLTQYPNGLVACVSDSFDIFKACEELWGTQLKDKIMNRNGTLVVRPDSGKPEYVVLRVLEILWDKFGGVVNNKGYKELDSHIRVIQGDGVNYDSIKLILGMLKAKGWSTDNIAFGMGGALLQNLNRDTQKFAFKCSMIDVDGVEKDVWKKPITDSGKDSKRGRLHLVKMNGEYKTHESDTMPDGYKDELVTVFENGELKVDYTLDEIRTRAKV